MVSFLQKYLKYKNKYLELKNQIGGVTHISRLDMPSFTKTYQSIIINREDEANLKNMVNDITNKLSIVKLLRIYFNKDLLTELTALSTEELEKITEKINNYGNFTYLVERLREYKLISVLSKILSTHKETVYNIIQKLFKINMNDLETIDCTVEQFMDNDFDSTTKCHNRRLVMGSCGEEQEFFKSLNNENYSNKSIIKLLNLIKNKLEKGKSIAIILGATTIYDSSCDINLYFNECKDIPLCEYTDFSENLKDITDNPLKPVYKISTYFPLNTEGTNRNVLDIILELTHDYKITLINQMCGSCFRSFYYLKKHAKKNFIYILKPEQGIAKDEFGPITYDSPSIRNCFREPYNNN